MRLASSAPGTEADRARRLQSLWSDCRWTRRSYWWAVASRDLALFGVTGSMTPRRDIWNFFDWTNFYDTDPMLETLKEHVDFDLLNASETSFVITAVDRVVRRADPLPQSSTRE